MQLLEVTVQTRAKNRGVEQLDDGGFRIRTNAAPADGAANRDVQNQLAQFLGVAKTRLSLVRGATTKKKLFLLA